MARAWPGGGPHEAVDLDPRRWRQARPRRRSGSTGSSSSPQEKEFTGGHYLNAHSVLHYGGGTKTVNALLDELSKVEGATLYVRLSKEAGVTRMLVGDRGPCSCSLDHNGWGGARAITLTIYLGGEGVDADAVALPTIQGH